LETYGGAYQLGEKLKEDGDMPAKRLIESNQTDKNKKQFSEEATKFESAGKWQLKAIEK
jgi:hypothetical protein